VVNDGVLPASVATELEADPEVSLLLGAAALDGLPGFEVILKSPGVSPHVGPSAAALSAARRAGARVTSATELWFGEQAGAVTVAVTGTKGKSTTAALIAHLLTAAGRRVALGGNIGRAMLDFVVEPPDPLPEIWVLELSSYQIADLQARPTVALLLNLYPEHLDWHGQVESYFADKWKLTQPSPSGARPEIVILNGEDRESQARAGALPGAWRFNDPSAVHWRDGWIYDGPERLLAAARVPLAGEHNLSNLCAALTAVRAVGVEPAEVVPAVESFQPLPHRLSLLGMRGGLLWVDDSISTTPQSAQAAVEAFPGRSITLLLGGYERGLDYGELARYLAHRPVERVITVPDSGPRIAHAVREARGSRAEPDLFEAQDLAEAVEQARSRTPPGGVVLLSPAAPSFGRFRDYRARGARFAQLAGFDP
jgi:UDP-N-acetylmuramoylalanine--D-glutamate ligase